MTDKESYFGVWVREKALTIRLAFAKLYDRDPRKAIEHVNERLAEASRMEENIARLRTTI